MNELLKRGHSSDKKGFNDQKLDTDNFQSVVLVDTRF